MLFREVRTEWWSGQTIGKHGVTIYRLSETIRCHISPYFDDVDIELISDVEINNYIKAELEHGNRTNNGPLCPNSVSKAVNIINNIFDYAVAKGYLNKNPVELTAKVKRVPSKNFSVFYPEEVDKLIQAARPKWLGDVILTAYHTGMRKGEIYGLQWCDVDFEHKFLHVDRSIASISPKEYFINDPKTKTSKRWIMLDDQMLDMLARRKEKSISEWVFENQYGREINPWYNVKYFRATCNKAGIPIRRFHDLRHTHITELVKAGIPLPVIQQRVGHTDIKMTMRYTHISPDMQQSAVDYLNNRA